jgi:hypothetical protein
VTVYSIFEKPQGKAAKNRVPRLIAPVAVPDRFSWVAAIVPPLYALFNGLWLLLIFWIALVVGLAYVSRVIGVEASGWLYVLVAVFLGFEASAFRRDGYLARIDRLVAMADIVKLSEEDIDWLEPGTDFADLATRWLEHGAKLVALTKGADGAVALSRAAMVEVPGVPVKVADTVGAGDTFTAGMLARLDARVLLTKGAVASLDQRAIADALGFAAKAAAITVSRPGADPPWLRELA